MFVCDVFRTNIGGLGGNVEIADAKVQILTFVAVITRPASAAIMHLGDCCPVCKNGYYFRFPVIYLLPFIAIEFSVH